MARTPTLVSAACGDTSGGCTQAVPVEDTVYVPGGLPDAEGKRNGEYLVFDPTGQQGNLVLPMRNDWV
ncbi:MAG: hypothetical protein J7502_03025 [Flavisolibacter sp.]|nr:hypothetical protein [Flavisolibacter sp.]